MTGKRESVMRNMSHREILLANMLVCLSVLLPVQAQKLDQLIPQNVLLNR
jgi:hypothetical protein